MAEEEKIEPAAKIFARASLRTEHEKCPQVSDSQTSGWDYPCTLVIRDNDAVRGDFAFRHFERCRYRAISEQPLSTAQRYRIYHQPERIDQIMLDKRLDEVTTSPNVQIQPLLLLDFGDFFRDMSVYKYGRLPFARSHGIRGNVLGRRVSAGQSTIAVKCDWKVYADKESATTTK